MPDLDAEDARPDRDVRVFISYRRGLVGSDDAVGWLYEFLRHGLGEDNVFKDVDSIRPGEDFIDAITGAIDACDVLLVIIGPQWLDVIDETGARRLDDPADFVRLEIEAALDRNVHIIPLLVADARMPGYESLPAPIARLARRQAVRLSAKRIGQLLAFLRSYTPPARRPTDQARSDSDQEASSSPNASLPNAGNSDPLVELWAALTSPTVQGRQRALTLAHKLLGAPDSAVVEAAEDAVLRLTHDVDHRLARRAFEVHQRWRHGHVRSISSILAARVLSEPGPDPASVPAGIDFGTTNSAIAVWHGGKHRVLRIDDAETIPSMIAASPTDDWPVGRPVQPKALVDPASTFRTIKLRLGSSWKETIYGRTYTAEDVAAIILHHLKTAAERQLAAPLGPVVLTVPAHFGLGEREATVRAAQLAGLDVARVINEPTAAALAYGLNHSHAEQTVLVFDLGGGTLDVSVLEIGDGVVEVKASTGNIALGGRDWDQRIADHLITEFHAERGIDLSADRVAAERVRDAAERIKIDLSGAIVAEVHVPFLVRDENDELLDLSGTLRREQLESLTADLLRRCRDLTESAIKDAGITAEQLDQVLLVGGSTRMPAVGAMLQQLSGKRPRGEILADGVVLGAAVQASVLSGAVRDVLLVDVVPYALSVRLAGNGLATLVPRNAAIPTHRAELFTTVHDSQTEVRIALFQGDAESPEDNRKIGTLVLSGLQPQPAGTLAITVLVDVDANGVVTVSAVNPATNAKESCTVTREAIAAHQKLPDEPGNELGRWIPPGADKEPEKIPADGHHRMGGATS